MSQLAGGQVGCVGDGESAAARLDRLPVSRWHRRLIAVVGVGTFFDLYEVFLGGTLAAVLTKPWHLGTMGSALVIASVFAGMSVGAIGLGMAADRFGRRRVFLANLVLYSVFSLLTAFAPNLISLIVLRVLAGLPLGAELALVGTYLSEFMPRRARGRGVAWAFTVGFCGIPAAAFLGGRFLANRHLFIDGWRWLLIFGAFGALGTWLLRRHLPESPRWLIAHGRVEQAEQLVTRIEDTVRRQYGKPLQPLEPVTPVASSQPDDSVTIGVMFSGRYRRRTIMLWIFHVLQTVGYYGFGTLAPLVLVAKGFTVTQSLGYTAASFLGYPVGAALAITIIERIERRTLIIGAALAMAACGLVFGWSTAPTVIVVSGFALTVASNVFAAAFHTYQPELFPTAVRGGAVGIAYSLSRVVAAVLPFIALTVLKHYGAGGVYLGSAAALAILCVNVAVLGPPSTGRPLEEVSVPGKETPQMTDTPHAPGRVGLEPSGQTPCMIGTPARAQPVASEVLPADRYARGILGHDVPTELQRLRLRQHLMDPTTKKIINQRGILPGWRCLELGAGTGSIAGWLARTCPAGHVVATDVDTRYLDAHRGVNLTVLRHDVVRDDFPPDSFDLIHTRSLLANLPERDAVLRKAARWLTPGGWLVVEEPGMFLHDSSPYPSFQKLMLAFERLAALSHGADLRWSRRLPALLSGEGLTEIGMSMVPQYAGDGGLGDSVWRVALNQARPALIQKKLLTEAEIHAGLALFDDPLFIDVPMTLVCVWARRS